MRFGTIDGRLVVVAGGRALDVAQASDGQFSATVRDALSRWPEFSAWAETADLTGAPPAERLGPPVPDPRQVFAVALNYRPHAAEAGFSAPDAPLVFTKFPSCITGPDADVVLPAGKVDWEIEVVAVVGTGGRHIPRHLAWAALAGLTIGQDLSERVLQSAGTPAQFSLGKSHAGFGPIGPVVVTADEFTNRDDIGFRAWLGDEIVQLGRTNEMIFPIDELVATLSGVCELFPGDLIFTGTPAGVGHRRTPPRYLRPGDVLTSEIDGVGSIVQRFRR